MTVSFCFRFGKLKPAVENRKHKLQDSLHFFQFKFDVDEEVQWIKEKLPAAASTDYGKSLVDAQNLQKKHQVCVRDSGVLFCKLVKMVKSVKDKNVTLHVRSHKLICNIFKLNEFF